LLNFVFELKFLNAFMGREDPIEFDILVEACSSYPFRNSHASSVI